MVNDRLVAVARVIVAGYVFNFTDQDAGARPGAPISISVNHGDQLSSMAHLVVWDKDVVADAPLPIYNSIPNPLISHNEPYDVWMGWEGHTLYKVFEGILQAKEASLHPSVTTLIGVHDSFRMKKEGKKRARTNITMDQLLRQLAAEYGLQIKYIGDAAGDPALTQILSWTVQGINDVRTNWQQFKHYLTTYGFIINTTQRGLIEIRKSKEGDPQFVFRRGDENGLEFSARQEQRRDERSSRRKVHTNEAKPGKRGKYETRIGVNDGSRYLETVPPSVAKRKANPYRQPRNRIFVRNIAKRLGEVEGDKGDFVMRLEPQLLNVEQTVLVDYGPQNDGAWQNASVQHSIGKGPSQTRVQAWKPPQ